MKKNKFSIIIPHLNEGYYLDIMLDCFYNYINYDNYEIIICDDGSDNLSNLDFLENHFLKNKITLYKNNKLGLSANKNFGASKSNGDVLIFLDSHIYFNEDILKKINNHLNNNLDFDLLQPIVGSILDKNIKGTIYKLKDPLLNSNWTNTGNNASVTITPGIIGCAMIVKKDVFDKLGGFGQKFKKWGVEDIEFSMRAWLSGYKCYLVKNININHYFKEKFVNTVVKSEDVLYNKIIFSLTCFTNKKRLNLILEELKKWYGDELFNKKYELIQKDIKLNNYIKQIQSRFKYDDDWYFKKFKQYYKDF